MIDNNGDLQVPFFAMRPMFSLSPNVKDMFSNKVRSPILFVTPSTSMYGEIVAINVGNVKLYKCKITKMQRTKQIV